MSRHVYVLSNRFGTANEHAKAMADGLKRHAFQPIIAAKGTVPLAGEFVVCWGWREGQRLRELGCNVLVMERGYLGDRFFWTSLGWNGLNGRATWNNPADNGERFDRYFGTVLKPWCPKPDGYALIVGQVPGDAALCGIDLDPWYIEAAEKMRARGLDVRFRPHPMAVKHGRDSGVLRDCRDTGDLASSLAGASVAVTWNSNIGCEAIMAGVPVIACDEGSMSWPLAAHGLDAGIVTPDRAEWCRAMAWRQWKIEEIASGEAWAHVREAMPMPQDGIARGKTALIVGGAHCVHDDLKAALALFEPDIILAVNDIGVDLPRVDAWCSMHPNKMPRWMSARFDNGHPDAKSLWTAEHKEAPPRFRRVVNPGGGSAALAAEVAFKLGAERIVLAGCPLTSEPHFFDDEPWAQREVAHYRRSWERHQSNWGPFIRSMSGWTMQTYGAPTREWVNDLSEANAA